MTDNPLYFYPPSSLRPTPTEQERTDAAAFVAELHVLCLRYGYMIIATNQSVIIEHGLNVCMDDLLYEMVDKLEEL